MLPVPNRSPPVLRRGSYTGETSPTSSPPKSLSPVRSNSWQRHDYLRPYTSLFKDVVRERYEVEKDVDVPSDPTTAVLRGIVEKIQSDAPFDLSPEEHTVIQQVISTHAIEPNPASGQARVIVLDTPRALDALDAPRGARRFLPETEVLVHVIFLILICAATFRYSTAQAARYASTVRNHYLDENFQSIDSHDAFFEWLSDVFVPDVYGFGAESEDDAQALEGGTRSVGDGPPIKECALNASMDCTASRNDSDGVRDGDERPVYVNGYDILVGVVRLRQVRVTRQACPVPWAVGDVVGHCFVDYDSSSESTETYGANYTYESVSPAYGYSGELAHYGAGGFMVNLPNNLRDARAMLASLEEGGWMDLQTRAIFIDISTFNPGINLMASMRLLVEFPVSGAAVTSDEINVLEVGRYQSKYDIFITFPCDVAIVGVLVYYAFHILRSVQAHGWRHIYSDNDNLYCVVMLGLFSVVYVLRALVWLVLWMLPSFVSNEFIDVYGLQKTFRMEETAMAFVALIVWTRTLKFTRLVPSTALYTKVLIAMMLAVMPFLFLLIVLCMAFAHAMMLFFHGSMDGYATIRQSFMTNCLALLGEFDYEAFRAADSFFGPLFFVLFEVVLWLFTLNLLVTVINGAYDDVVDDDFKKEAVEEASKANVLGDVVKMVTEKIKPPPTAEELAAAAAKAEESKPSVTTRFVKKQFVDMQAEMKDHLLELEHTLSRQMEEQADAIRDLRREAVDRMARQSERDRQELVAQMQKSVQRGDAEKEALQMQLHEMRIEHTARMEDLQSQLVKAQQELLKHSSDTTSERRNARETMERLEHERLQVSMDAAQDRKGLEEQLVALGRELKATTESGKREAQRLEALVEKAESERRVATEIFTRDKESLQARLDTAERSQVHSLEEFALQKAELEEQIKRLHKEHSLGDTAAQEQRKQLELQVQKSKHDLMTLMEEKNTLGAQVEGDRLETQRLTTGIRNAFEEQLRQAKQQAELAAQKAQREIAALQMQLTEAQGRVSDATTVAAQEKRAVEVALAQEKKDRKKELEIVERERAEAAAKAERERARVEEKAAREVQLAKVEAARELAKAREEFSREHEQRRGESAAVAELERQLREETARRQVLEQERKKLEEDVQRYRGKLTGEKSLEENAEMLAGQLAIETRMVELLQKRNGELQSDNKKLIDALEQNGIPLPDIEETKRRGASQAPIDV